MPSLARVAVGLLVIAGLLFAAPPYVDALLDDGDARSTMELGARPLGESQGGEPIDETKDLVQTWGGEYAIDLGRYDALAARDRTDHLECSRDVNGTVAVMRQATDDGQTVTADGDVAADLACMADRYDYYRPPDDEQRGYRAFTVATDDGETIVETRPVNGSELADAIRARELVEYGELNATERRTVDRILENSSDPYGAYRPPADDPILDRSPVLLQTDGETRVIEVVGHVDDFNAAALVLYLGLRAAAALSLLGALVASGVAVYRRGRANEAGASGSTP